ncbi:MAG: ATP synthase F0 subunit B [Oscillospiraceae bacterium]|jgi:F-type H+-transporting ATPase subunit b|nr:ATP synthase F0 subunit B [Oscillospiraceae bacterium]
MDLQPQDILLHVINVAVLYFLLRRILWKPVNKFLAARADRVRKELDDAAAVRAEAETLRGDYAAKIEGLEAEGRDILRESQQRATEQSNLLLESAKEQAEKMLDGARERIEEERRRAVEAARHDISALAGELASRVLKREVSANDDLLAAANFFDDGKE